MILQNQRLLAEICDNRGCCTNSPIKKRSRSLELLRFLLYNVAVNETISASKLYNKRNGGASGFTAKCGNCHTGR